VKHGAKHNVLPSKITVAEMFDRRYSDYLSLCTGLYS
jgi:hypothetical protein